MKNNYFDILEEREIPELNSFGIYAKHKKTGLELFHLVNDDEENCFSFAFLTPAKNSTGVQHILEHCSLCGSKNYPIKDPFLTLMQQNLTTFLNAMTFPDKTVYPACSLVEEEYFTAMSVYGDAVFFPLLKKEAFEQEGWRFERDENATLNLQGVVFNEMLAVYSDFNQLAFQNVQAELFSGTPYEYDTGGDPRCIPNLRYEDFIAYHKKYYHPSNCKLFLYGNIPTEKQMNFLHEKFLKSFNKSVPIEKIKALKDFPAIKKIKTTAPASSAKADDKNLLLFTWSVGESQNTKEALLNTVIAEILFGSDASPLSKKILDSKLGELFPYNQISFDNKNTILVFGVNKINPGNEQEVEKLIFKTLNDIANTKLDKKILETALNKIDFENKEIVRPSGQPFSLQLMRKAYNAWMYGATPFDGLHYISIFESLRNEILNNENYLQNEIKKRLIKNKNLCIGLVTPDKNFSDKMEQSIAEHIKKFEASLNDIEKEKLLQNKKIAEHKNINNENENNDAIVPHISVKDLPQINENLKKVFTRIGNIPAIIYEQNTNAITYISFAIPFDNLNDEEYYYAKLYTEALNEMGFGKLSWYESLNEQSRIFGGIDTNILLSGKAFKQFNELDSQNIFTKNNFLERDWIFVSVKLLETFINDGVKFICELLEKVNFNDTERLFNILKQVNTAFENIPPTNGHNLAIIKSNACLNKDFERHEKVNGISQFEFIKDLIEKIENKDLEISALSTKLNTIHKKIFDNGLLIHLTCEEKNIQESKNALEKNLKNFKALQDKSFGLLRKTNSAKVEFNRILNLVPAEIQVAHSAFSFDFPEYGAKNFGKISAFRTWLSSSLLWDSIRVLGGAYGAFAVSFDNPSIFSFITYRDPNAINSLLKIKEILKSVLDKNLNDEEMEKIIIGAYANILIPKTPYQKSFADFCRLLNGKAANAKSLELEGLKETSCSDLKNFAKILLEENRKSVATILANKKSFKDLSNVEKVFDKIEISKPL